MGNPGWGVRLTRIFSEPHTQSRHLARAAIKAIPISKAGRTGKFRAKRICKLAGKLDVYRRDRPDASPNGAHTGAHTSEGGGEPWQDHVLA